MLNFKSISLGFVFLLSVLIASIMAGFWAFKQMTEAYYWRAHTYLVLAETRAMSESLFKMDSQASLHALTNDKKYLAPLLQGQTAFTRHWQQAQFLTTDNPVEQRRLTELRTLYALWQREYLKPLLDAQHDLSSSQERQTEMVLVNRDRANMDQMLGLVAAMDSEEEALLQERQQQANDFHIKVQQVSVGSDLLALLLVGGLAVLLTRNTRKLEEANAELEHEIVKRQQAMQDAHHARDEAEHANRSKSEFLSRMSHELRTPLNAILGFGQLLEMDDLDAEQQDSVRHILKGGQHLLILINEVLDFARIEAGHLHISPEPVQVSDVFQEVFDLLRPLSTARSVQLHNETSEEQGALYVLADRQRLKQVILNFVSNAIKYNRVEGQVMLSATPAGPRHLRLAVRDTGLGIPPDKQVRLFQPFERLGAEQSTVEGTGLGLALSKRLVEAMKGQVGVESVVGEGSTFWVELPLVEGPLAQLEEVEGLAPEPHPHASNATVNATVLYIEDNLANLELIKRLLLQRPGVHLLEAMQGRLGLELAQKQRLDLILLDLHLPDLSGHELLLRLQADEHLRAVPVVVLSADATPGQIRRLLSAGACDYLTKPIDVARFFAVLDGYLMRPND